MSEVLTKFLSIIILLILLWGIKESYSYWRSFKATHPAYGESGNGSTAQARPVAEQNLPGLPPNLEGFLDAAKKQGTKTFRKWLDFYQPQISDPRLAWIQLDYVVMVSSEDMIEAKRVFAEVKGRITKESPVFPRIKQLEKAYE